MVCMTNQVLANLSYSGHHHYQKQKDLALKCCEKSAPRYAERLFSSSFYKVSVKVSFRQNPPRSEAEKPIKTVVSETKTFFEINFNQNRRNQPGVARLIMIFMVDTWQQYDITIIFIIIIIIEPTTEQESRRERADFDIVSNGVLTVGRP